MSVLAMAGVGLSPAEFERNFDLDPDRVNELLHGLAEKDLVEHIGDGYFDITERGEVRVEVRGERSYGATVVGD